MARITVEDCLEVVPNRFQLIIIAANRARELHMGAEPVLQRKPHESCNVLALREIASGRFNQQKIQSLLVMKR